MDGLANSASKKLAAVGREMRWMEYKLKKKAQQSRTGTSSSRGGASSASTPRNGNGNRSRTATGGRGDISQPSTVNEEELQLQLALQLSKTEHDQRETKVTKDKEKDDLRIEMAIKESLKESSSKSPKKPETMVKPAPSADLLGLDPWETPTNVPPKNPSPIQTDPFMTAPPADPWGYSMPPPAAQQPLAPTVGDDPWASISTAHAPAAPPTIASSDPWGAVSAAPATAAGWGNADPFSSMGGANQVPIQPIGAGAGDIFATGGMNAELNVIGSNGQPVSSLDNLGKDLGSKFFDGIAGGANLVNLSTIIHPPPVNVDALNNNKSPSPAHYNNNPFASFNTAGRSNNPFQDKEPAPTLAQMQQQRNQEKVKDTNGFSSSPAQLYPQLNQTPANAFADDPFSVQSFGAQPQTLQPTASVQNPTNPFT